jgi:hypothetical protein
MLEAVVEAALVVHRAGDDHMGMCSQQPVHALFVPRAVGKLPTAEVRVHGQVASTPELVQERRLPCA